LFQQIQDARDFTVAGGQPYGDAMIVNISFTLVFNTGLFPNACRDWQVRLAAQKTWINFKGSFLGSPPTILFNKPNCTAVRVSQLQHDDLK
jgi:hypothetical protein